MDDGVTFDAGDRQMTVVRPPLCDSATTRGLLDTKTGVYWAVDSFATPVPGGQEAEILPEMSPNSTRSSGPMG
jgi:hypothetical protein